MKTVFVSRFEIRNRNAMVFSLYVYAAARQVVRGRPIPHQGTALVLKNFPVGFPEFVCCVGQMKPVKFKETSGKLVITRCCVRSCSCFVISYGSRRPPFQVDRDAFRRRTSHPLLQPVCEAARVARASYVYENTPPWCWRRC